MSTRKSNIKSRLAAYQSGIQLDEIPQQTKTKQIDDLFEAEQDELDNIEIAFDANDIIANFGKDNSQEQEAPEPKQREFLDPFADIPVIMKNASSDGSDFYDQEDQDNVMDMQPVVQTSTIEPEFNIPSTVNEIDRGFVHETEAEEDYGAAKPFTLGSLAQIPNPVNPTSTSSSYSNNVNSYMNYQMSAAMRGANKKKPAVKAVVSQSSSSRKPDILMENDDIGEVGEWVGKSANVNAKKEDDEDEDDEEDNNRNDDDDFEGIFEATTNSKSVPQKPKASTNEDEEEQEEKPAAYNYENIAKQSNLAMQKATGGSTAFKGGKNRGPFMNSLKEKADKLKKIEDVATDGEIKIKQTLQVGLDNMKTSSSTNAASRNGDNIALNEADEEEESPKIEETGKKVAQEVSTKGVSAVVKEKTEAQKAALNLKIDTQKDKIQGIANSKIDDVKKKAQEVKVFSGSESESPVKNLEDEWERVTKATAQQAAQKDHNNNQITALSFSEAWETAKKIPLADERRRVQEEVNASRGFLQKLFSCGKGGLPAALLEERDQILALAKVPFNEDDEFHFNLLQSIYIKITGKVKEVPRFGPHWETIGFQGRDPATDLRGVGILGLLQILAFVSNHGTMFKKMWQHSTHEKYNFPLCISGFSVTQAMMETLRAEKLNPAIMARKSVIEVFNEGYYAAFYKLVNIYETNQYTIAEYPLAKRNALEMLKTNPTKMLFDFRAASMSLASPLSK